MAVNPVNDASSAEQAERRRRARRAAVLLGLVAAAFYVGFMVLTYFRSQH
jgi:uncharacterized membrane protein (DUF485 family)